VVRFPIFSLRHRVQTDSGTHSASYPMLPGSLSLGLKRPGCEADNLLPSSAEIKNAWSYASNLILLHSVMLI